MDLYCPKTSVAAEADSGDHQHHERTAGRRQTPAARAVPDPPEAARAGVEEHGKQQPGEHKEEAARGLPNKEQSRGSPERDQRKLETAPRELVGPCRRIGSDVGSLVVHESTQFGPEWLIVPRDAIPNASLLERIRRNACPARDAPGGSAQARSILRAEGGLGMHIVIVQ